MNKEAEHISYNDALNKGKELLNTDKKYLLGFLIIVAINTGLKINKILELKYEDFDDENLYMNRELLNAYSILKLKRKHNLDLIFISNKLSVYRTQSINGMLKKEFSVPISTSSFRVAFGVKAYEMKSTEKTLQILSFLFNHTSIRKTKLYLNI